MKDHRKKGFISVDAVLLQLIIMLISLALIFYFGNWTIRIITIGVVLSLVCFSYYMDIITTFKKGHYVHIKHPEFTTTGVVMETPVGPASHVTVQYIHPITNVQNIESFSPYQISRVTKYGVPVKP